MILLPNINEAIADLKGKLLPFGWAKLLWRLKVKGLKTVRVPLMGVQQEVRRQPARPAPALPPDRRRWRTAARKLGYERYELSWILGGQPRPCAASARPAGAEVYKTYRLYEKALG